MFLERVTILATPVSIGCNLRCRYCFHRDMQAVGQGTGRMSLETLELLTTQAARLSPHVRFIWHGGEPTLTGINFYKHALQIQGSCETLFRNHIQTNGTLLNCEWLDFFQENDFHVGISLDGPPEVHDRQRVYPDGRGTFWDVFRAAQEIADNLRHFGVLTVITKHSLGMEEEIFDFLSDHFTSVNLLPYYEVNPRVRKSSSLTITPSECAEFMKRFFDIWIDRDDPRMVVSVLRQWVRAAVGLALTSCRFSGCCAEYITVDANGDVYPCDRFNGERELCFGNLHRSTLSEILTGEHYARFRAAVEQVDDECLECRWWQVCQGDCTHYRYQGNGQFTRRSYFCTAQKQILEHVHNRVGDIVTAIQEQIWTEAEVK